MEQMNIENPQVITAAAAAAKSLQSCPTLCDPIDGSPPGSQARESQGRQSLVGCCLLQKHSFIISIFPHPYYHLFLDT